MFELRNASKRFGPTAALKAVDLDIAAGRTTVLLGPSGCGKSTLLHLLLGLTAPDGGEVRFQGSLVSQETACGLWRRMGYVIQDGGLFPHLRARDNVALMARYLGRSRVTVASRLGELAELTRFPPDHLDRFPVQLSGGQRQRVGLMRALMLDPDVLLLDEPLGALDPMIRGELQDDLRRIFRALGKTVVMVTHDLAEAGFFADAIVLMAEGRIVQHATGGLAELVRAPADAWVTRFVSAQRRSMIEES